MGISKHTAIGFMNGDKEAIGQVYLEYKNLMYFIIASYVNNQNDCDDVLSDSFHQVDVFEVDRIEDRNGDPIHPQYNGVYSYYTVNKNEDCNVVIVAKRYSQNLDIESFTLENAGVSCIEVNYQAGFYASGPYTEIAANYYSHKMRFTEGDYEICFTLSGLETKHLIIRAR